jgi:hypothetical protein
MTQTATPNKMVSNYTKIVIFQATKIILKIPFENDRRIYQQHFTSIELANVRSCQFIEIVKKNRRELVTVFSWRLMEFCRCQY